MVRSEPFHLYSMRQAIEEGFILDVLKNYTTYKTYYSVFSFHPDSFQPLYRHPRTCVALAHASAPPRSGRTRTMP